MTIAPEIDPELSHQRAAGPRLAHRDYQSFWTTQEGPGWLTRVIDQAATWLRDQLGLDLDLTADGDVRSTDRSKRAQILHRSAGREHGIRLRVWNANNGQTFIVTVLAVETPRGGWLQIEVTCTDPQTVVRKPKVADQILEVVEFRDVTTLRPEAEYTSITGLDSLEALINAPDRRLPVIVAAPLDEASFDPWNTFVNTWTRRTVGLAHVHSLDPVAAREFHVRHGDHAVRPGTLRTYPAGADLSDPVTARTARWLGHQSLAGSNDAVEKTIESFVRQHAASQPLPLPSAAREWARAFTRIANIKLREAVTPRTSTSDLREQLVNRRQQLSAGSADAIGSVALPRPPAPSSPLQETSTEPQAARQEELQTLREQLATARQALTVAEQKLHVVQQTLMLDDLSEAALLDLLDAATRTVPDQGAIDTLLESNEALQERIEHLEELFLNEQIEKSDVRKQLDRLDTEYSRSTREVIYLRSKLAESDPEAAYAFSSCEAPQNPLGDCPPTWEAVAQSSVLKDHRIVITANTKRFKELASIDVDGAALSAAWEALGTLAAYREAVLADSWAGDVHDFCDSAPADRFHVPPNKHARNESAATKQDKRYSKTRLLPVPKSVDSRGETHMWAHFKPYSWAAEKKLRIHYFDQVRTDGSIYVGHVGEHLPSASTTKVRR